MTRDEEIRNAIDTTFPIPPSEKGRTYEQALMATGFENGVKWADTHPKSPWISVEDDLPCYHPELMRNEVFTKKIIVLLNDGRIRDTDMFYDKWCQYRKKITHWKPFIEPIAKPQCIEVNTVIFVVATIA